MEPELRHFSVLIVDDDREGSELMAEFLRESGYSVLIANNGYEGLNILQWARPALILLDVHMPIMDGPHFREAQRRDRQWIEIPTVVMTADPHVERMLDMAVENTLRKPIRRRELLEMVERYCTSEQTE